MIAYDSYMLQDSDLTSKDPRLLAVDKPLLLPTSAVVNFYITASDVLHS